MSLPPRRVHARGAALARLLGLLPFLFCTVLTLVPHRLHAQQDQVEVPGYRDAVAEAVSEFDAQNYPEARRHFARAHKMYPNARTLRGLAAVSFELRRYVETMDFCAQALASEVRPLTGSMRQETESLLARARDLVAELTLDVEPASALVSVDGSAPRQIPDKPLLLDVGDHRLEFEASGYESQRRAFTAEGGESETHTIVLRRSTTAGPESSGDSAARAGPESRRVARWRLAAGGVSLALGGAAFAVAGALMAKRLEAGQQLRATNVEDLAYDPQLQRWRDKRAGPYFFAAAGAAVMTAGALVILLGVEREAIPVWSAVVTGVVGLGLASWGLAEIAGGASCNGDAASMRRCSDQFEHRDRGALLLFSAAPMLSVPLTQLARWAVGSADSATGRVAIAPSFDLSRTTMSFEARVVW